MTAGATCSPTDGTGGPTGGTRFPIDRFVWDERCVNARQLSRDLPRVARIKDLGYGELESGDRVAVEQALLLYASRCSSKVIASNVYWNESRAQYVPIGPKLAVPVNNQGWFLILADNRIECADSWNSVLGVAKAQPTWVICHEPLHVFRFAKQASGGKDRVYHGKMLKAGEVLSVGEVVKYSMAYCDSGCWIGSRRRSSIKVSPMFCACGHPHSALQSKSASQFLQCTTSDGHEVLLPASSPTALFSRVGDLDTIDIRCVYQLADLARREQTPFIVKLVLGEPPDAPNCHFTGMLRIECVKYNECLVGCMIEESDKPILVEVPLDSDVEFVPAINTSELIKTEKIRSFLNYCDYNIDDYLQQMKVVHDFYPDATPASIGLSRAISARCLPPLPTVMNTTTDEQSAALQHESIIEQRTSAIIEQCTETEVEIASTCAGDSIYETIPHAYRNFALTTDENDVELNASGATAASECGWEDEDGYLVPVKSPPVMPSAGCSNDAFCLENHPELPSQADAESISSERLNSFLADSIDELDRLNLKTRSHYPSTPVRKSVSSCDSDAIPVLNSKESVGAYLDRIFDCDDASLSGAQHSSCESDDSDDADDNDGDDDDNVNLPTIVSPTEPPYAKRIPDYTDDKMNSVDGYARVTDPYALSLDTTESPPGDQYHTSVSHDWSLGRASSRLDSGVDTSTYSASSDYGTYSRRFEVESPYRSVSDTIPYAFTISSWTPPENVTSLTVDEVIMSMRHIGMSEQVVRRVGEEALDGKQLSELTDDLLRAGFPEFNAFERKKIVDFASGWRPKIV